MAAGDYKVKEFLFGIVIIANLGHVLSRSLPTGNAPCPMPALQYPYPFQGNPALPGDYYNPQIPQVYQPPQPVGTFYDSKRGILRPFPGGGLPVLVDYHKRCSNNFVGIKPHPNQRQYYYVCKPDCVIFGKCQNLQYFDATKYQCTPYPTLNYSPFCTKPGRFPILSDCTIYYRCDENLKPRIHTCPKNTVFSPQKEKCISGAQCNPTEVSPYGSHIPQDCENKFPPCLHDGTFRSPTDCSLYYTCTMQMKGIYLQTRFKCPELTFYDTTRGACWPQHEVACDCIQLSELVYPRPPPLSHLPVIYPRHYSWDSLEDSEYPMDSSKSSFKEDTFSLSVGSNEDPDQTMQTSFSRKKNSGLPSTDRPLTTLFNEEFKLQSIDLTSSSPALITDHASSATSDPLTTTSTDSHIGSNEGPDQSTLTKLSEEENAAALQDNLAPITTTTTEPTIYTMEPPTLGPSTESPSLFNEELVWQSNDLTPASPALPTDVASSATSDPLTTKFSEEENVAVLQDNPIPVTTTMDPSTLGPSTENPTLFNEELVWQSIDLTSPSPALTTDPDSLATPDTLTTMSTDSTIGSNEGPDHSTLTKFSEEENAAVLQNNLVPVTTTMDPSTLGPSTESPTLFNEEFDLQSIDLTNPNTALTPDTDSLTTSDPVTTMSTDYPIGSNESPDYSRLTKFSERISAMEPSTLGPSTESTLPALFYEELMLESLDLTGSSPALTADPSSLPTTPKTTDYTQNSIQNSIQTPPETHNTEINNVLQNEIRYARSNTATILVGAPESNEFDDTDISDVLSDEVENTVYSNEDDSSWLTTTPNMRKNNSTNENRTQTTRIISNNPIDSNFSNTVKRMASTGNVVPKNSKPATERRNKKTKLNHPRGNRADDAKYCDDGMQYNEVIPAIHKVWPMVEAVLTTERSTCRNFTTSSLATKVEDAEKSFGLGIESTMLKLTTNMTTPKKETEEFRTLPTAVSSIKQTKDDKVFEITLEAEKPQIPILKRSFDKHEENVTTRQIEENAKRSTKGSSTEKTLVDESATTKEKPSEATNTNADLIFTTEKAKKDRKGLKELKVAEKPCKISTAKRLSTENTKAESFEATSRNTETEKNTIENNAENLKDIHKHSNFESAKTATAAANQSRRHAHRISAAVKKKNEAKNLEDSQKLSTTGSLGRREKNNLVITSNEASGSGAQLNTTQPLEIEISPARTAIGLTSTTEHSPSDINVTTDILKSGEEKFVKNHNTQRNSLSICQENEEKKSATLVSNTNSSLAQIAPVGAQSVVKSATAISDTNDSWNNQKNCDCTVDSSDKAVKHFDTENSKLSQQHEMSKTTNEICFKVNATNSPRKHIQPAVIAVGGESTTTIEPTVFKPSLNSENAFEADVHGLAEQQIPERKKNALTNLMKTLITEISTTTTSVVDTSSFSHCSTENTVSRQPPTSAKHARHALNTIDERFKDTHRMHAPVAKQNTHTLEATNASIATNSPKEKVVRTRNSLEMLNAKNSTKSAGDSPAVNVIERDSTRTERTSRRRPQSKSIEISMAKAEVTQNDANSMETASSPTSVDTNTLRPTRHVLAATENCFKDANELSKLALKNL